MDGTLNLKMQKEMIQEEDNNDEADQGMSSQKEKN